MTERHVIQAAGIERENQGLITTARGRVLEFDFLSYVTRGEGRFETKTKPCSTVKAGTMIYVPAGVRHVFDPKPGVAWCEYWVLLERRPAAALFGHLLPKEPQTQPMELRAALLEPWRELSDLWLFRQPGYREYGLFLLHHILIEAYLRRHPLRRHRPTSMVAQAEFRMRAELDEGNARFHIKRLADIAGTSYDHFRKQFKAETGLSPKQYWLNLIMQRACDLLINPNRTIKEVAATLGFDDPYHFSRLFKAKVGLSPEHYRKRHYR